MRRILVPLDGSPLAEEALGHATAIATSLDAEILLLRVVEASPRAQESAVSAIDWRLRCVEAEAYLREAAAGPRADGVRVTPVVAEGRAAQEIVSFARDRGVDLVVLSAYGQGDASDFDLGGTVHKVLSSVAASVMVIHPGTVPVGAGGGSGYRRIVVAVDGSAVAEWGLLQAVPIAARQGAELVVLEVLPEPDVSSPRLPRSPEETELLERLRRLQRERAEQYVARLASRLACSGLRVHHRVISAPRWAEGIRDAAMEEEADLLVVSSRATGEPAHPFGVVPERLFARCTIPLLVLQNLAEEAGAEVSVRKIAGER